MSKFNVSNIKFQLYKKWNIRNFSQAMFLSKKVKYRSLYDNHIANNQKKNSQINSKVSIYKLSLKVSDVLNNPLANVCETWLKLLRVLLLYF